MTANTTHKGFRITFNEDMEKWYCNEIGKSNQSLRRLKAQIDSHARNIRAGVAVEAAELSAMFSGVRADQDRKTASLEPVKVVEFLGEGRNFQGRPGPVEVAVIPEGRSRKTARLGSLYKLTPENQAVLDRAHQKGLEAVSVVNQMWLILGELERLSVGDVAELKKLYDEPKNEE